MIDMHDSKLRLFGKTFDFTINYKNIKKIFMMPQPDQNKTTFVMLLKRALRVGGTSHQYLIMEFKTDDEAVVTVQRSEEERAEIFDGKLKQEYDAPKYVTLARILKLMVGINIVIPGGFVK